MDKFAILIFFKWRFFVLPPAVVHFPGVLLLLVADVFISSAGGVKSNF
jgi:hypothetical protein